MSDPGRAQPVTSSIEIASVDASGGPLADRNAAPKVSDDGTIIVFDSAPSPEASTPTTASTTPPSAPPPPAGVVTIRDRASGTTTKAPDAPSLHPGVSGDGCVVAYSVPVTANGTVQLMALDRCAAVGGSLVGSAIVVDTVTAPAALPAPALSTDGSVIVWSTGRAIVRYVETTTGFDASPIAIPPALFATSGVVTGSGVDISADGNVVVFVAGPGATPYGPSPSNVAAWSDSDGTGPLAAATSLVSTGRAGGAATGDSTAPSLSGDGRIVVFQSTSGDLAVAPTTPPASGPVAPFVAVVDRQGTGSVLAPGTRPTIAADGRSVVYDTTSDVHIKRWVAGTSPFASVSDASLSIGIDGVTSAGPSASGAALSGDGQLVVFDSAAGAALSTDGRFATGTHVWVRATVDPPPTTTTTTLPATTTTAGGGAGGGATSTAPPVTSGPEPLPPATTLPATTFPANPRVPPTTAPTYRPPTGSGSGSTSRPGSGSGSRGAVGNGSTPFYSSEPIETVAFVPAGIEFSPTIVDAGRQSAVISISNPTVSSATVQSLSFQGDSDGAFAVSDNGCEAVSVPSGGSCDVTISYAPTSIGTVQVSIVATLSDGSIVYGTLAGTGAPAPIVSIVPGVASSGQVVAIRGSGFPSSITVELSWLGRESARSITVDESGSFVETLIVMSHTPRGPATASVVGQTDLFSTVVGEVLITDTSERSSSVLTQSAGSPFGS